MTKQAPLALLLLAAACATASKRGAERFPQAEHGLPAATAFAEGPERAAYAAAHAHEAKCDAGSGDAARAEWAQAAAGYASLAGQPGAAEWRVPLRHRAAELYLRAQRWDKASEVATALAGDAQASDASRAVAARLAATAALGAAGAAVRAGHLEKLDLSPAGKGGAPRAPAPGWARFVEATDAWLARAAADPEAQRAPAERRPGVSPAELALVAAEVQYAAGDLDGARRRFEAVMERWPAEAEVVEQAAPLYLATFTARGDREAHDAALARLRKRVAEEAARATDARQKEAFAKVQASLGSLDAVTRFAAAEKLVADGKPAEGAKAFEALAGDPGAGDPATALHNAAVAWDKAGEGDRAAQVRERLVKEHPASPVAPENALGLAARRSKAGDHLGSARAYDDFLARWPQAPSRCVALRNVASELDVAGRAAEAAERYLAFGADAGCAKDDPDVAARALVRAGKLFEGRAKAAYDGAADVTGLKDAEVKRLVAEAKKRRKGL
jgi:hypothetical protein